MFDEYMSKEDEDGGDKPKVNETSAIGFDSLLAAMKRDSNEEPQGSSMWTEMSKKLSKTSALNGKNSQPRSLLVNDATKPVQNR